MHGALYTARIVCKSTRIVFKQGFPGDPAILAYTQSLQISIVHESTRIVFKQGFPGDPVILAYT